MEKLAEYKRRVVYQIYPASFCDSNNDGWGDIQGIISKLDYIKDLGCGIIWLSPIYKSPMVDMGYDISDYKDINPLFGTMDDFDQLMEECNKRDIKVVMDLVVNHTSSEHPWFKEAIKNPTTKYRNYYYFKKGKGKDFKNYPNNWTSCFAGPAWEPLTTDPTTYYLHLYTAGQPDLNFHNEEVILEVENILKFWLDKGVYGFRCDCINELYKSSFENGKPGIMQVGREYYEDQPGNHEILRRFREDVLNNYDCFLVGENASAGVEESNFYIEHNELEMLITFKHQSIDKVGGIPVFLKKVKGKDLLKIFFDFQEHCLYNCWYLENHDQKRSASRLINEKYYKEGAKALATLLLTLKGTPFIYQGEEIGMKNIKNQPSRLEDTKDVTVTNVYSLLRKYKISKKLAFKLARNVSRDDERTPMQWNDRLNAGFNNGRKPWMPVNENYIEENINVAFEEKDKNSILNYYKSLINFRNKSNVLLEGDFIREKSNPYVAKFIREFGDKRYLVIINLSDKYVRDKELRNRQVLFSNYKDDFSKMLPPYFAAIYEII